MILEIKTVRHCKEKECGYFVRPSRNRMKIVVSEKRNPTLAEYGATLLHEMLHAYIEMLEDGGFKVGRRVEHEWIYACETEITKLMVKYLGKRRK